ncbi:hypothetical protein GOBAR_AA17906 [Gossypium barbadense]|uniref:Uncharacterized protein n=1 Tax=Gossypium barbadense TaxID=3634 RepID=A0A2P5XHB4_GOSBA|nr:hypothetical protein GOBAR_AA17906 [Gossypium barbadense]
MDGEDDAPKSLMEEMYANGIEGVDDAPSSSTSTTIRKNRPIISSEQLDIEAYAALYSGRTKIMRLIFLADHCDNSGMQLEALRMAYDELKKGENTQLFREVVQKIDGRLGPNYSMDAKWCAIVDRKADQRKDKLESELNAYRKLVRAYFKIQMGNLFCCVQVDQSTVAIKERFGRFEDVLEPGCHCLPWFLGSQLAGHLSLRLQQLDVRCETKTKLSSVWKYKRRVKVQKPCPNLTARNHFSMYRTSIMESPGSSGYLIVDANGGLNQQRSAVNSSCQEYTYHWKKTRSALYILSK